MAARGGQESAMKYSGVLEAAKEICSFGFYPIPVHIEGKLAKHPVGEGWTKKRYTTDDCETVFDNGHHYGLGVLMGISHRDDQLVPCDLDWDCPEAIEAAKIIGVPPTSRVFGHATAPESHHEYLVLTGFKGHTKFEDPVLGEEGKGNEAHVTIAEIHGKGRQVIFPPTPHQKGGPRIWSAHGEFTVHQFNDIYACAAMVASAVAFARYGGDDWEKYLCIAGLLARGGCDKTIAGHIVRAAGILARPNDRNAPGWLDGVTDQAYGRIEAGETVFGFPKFIEIIGERNAKLIAKAVFKWLQLKSSVTSAPLPNLAFAERVSDTGNAARFCLQHAVKFRFCAEQGIWYVWNGRRWLANDIGSVTRAAQETARSIFREAEAEPDHRNAKELGEWAASSLDRSSIKAMIGLAEHQLAVEVLRFSEFDAYSHLLNCPNGVVDLKTGKPLPHDRNLLITKMTGTPYDPDATCPQFLKFLRRAINAADSKEGDDYIRYVQRVLGYSLTGETREQVIFLLIGATDSGKSTLIRLVHATAGEYACTLPESTLVYSKQPPKDYSTVDLAAARIATCVETGKNKKLDEAKIKALTGEDKPKGARKYEQPVDFTPQAKIFLATNYPPRIHADDDALWRRLQVIKFPTSVPKDEQDKTLTSKLIREESKGILAWIVQGAIDWYKNGLETTPEVDAAGSNYRNQQDLIKTFINQCCEVSDLTISGKKLYDAYRYWVEQSNLGRAVSNVEFGREMSRIPPELGLKETVSAGVRTWFLHVSGEYQPPGWGSDRKG
jgi:P4 family phage/plasmid primase-like protien